MRMPLSDAPIDLDTGRGITKLYTYRVRDWPISQHRSPEWLEEALQIYGDEGFAVVSIVPLSDGRMRIIFQRENP